MTELVDACRYCGHRQADHSVEGLNPCSVCRCESWQRIPVGGREVWFSKLDDYSLLASPHVPLSVRTGGRRKRAGWWLKGVRERVAIRLAPWLRH